MTAGAFELEQQENLPIWLDAIHITFRTLFLTLLVLTAVRLMGKRSVSNLAPFDLVVIIIMGSVAAIPMEEQTGLVHGIVPIVVLAGLQWLLAWLGMKYRKVERVVQGVSTVLVKDGKILHQNLDRERVSLADLWLSLREKGISRIADIQQAAIEPDGHISVVKTQAASPLTPKDLYGLPLSRIEALTKENHVRLERRLRQTLESRRRRTN